MSLKLQSDLPKLVPALNRYQELTGKSWGDIMANESKSFAIELNQAFKRISPSVPSLVASASGRSYAMGRRSSRITPATAGLSSSSLASAQALMGSQAEDYFRVTITASGAPVIRKAMFSGRIQKRTGLRRLLIGGRFGNKFASSALKASQVEEESIREALKRGDVRKLNLRAVASAIELNRRAQAAKGGLMGLQWLPEVYRKRKSSVLKNGPLQSRSDTGIPIGEITFTTGKDGEPIGVTLTGFVPGTAEQASKHGILAQVDGIRAADRQAYIDRKMREQASEAFKG